METLVEERAAGFAFIARALGVVGAIALVLSIMGIYSLMAFLTAQRTQEIGVRMALGAGRWQVVRAITSRAIVITAIGASIGSGLALGLGRAMESLLFGLVSISLVQLVSLVTVLAAVALLACYLPARRAALRSHEFASGYSVGRGAPARLFPVNYSPVAAAFPPRSSRQSARFCRLDVVFGASRRGSRSPPRAFLLAWLVMPLRSIAAFNTAWHMTWRIAGSCSKHVVLQPVGRAATDVIRRASRAHHRRRVQLRCRVLFRR